MSSQINQIYEFGDFRLETAEQLLLRRGEPIQLTRKVFDTLLVARLVHEEIETTDEPKSHVTSADVATIEIPAVKPRLVRANRVRAVLAVATAAVLIAVVTFAVWSWNSPAPKLESIAILTLRPLNDEPTNADLGLGLIDALITKLAGLRTITVRPTSAVVKFAKSDLDALEVGRRLKTDTVLEGTIQQSEGRIRVTARLLQVKGGEQIWSDKFDEPASEIFKLQDALANKIARSLALELKKAELEQLNSRPTKNPGSLRRLSARPLLRNSERRAGFDAQH